MKRAKASRPEPGSPISSSGVASAAILLQFGAQLLHHRLLPIGRRCRGGQQLARRGAAPGFERALDRAQQLGERKRLLDEVEGAEARRFDGGLDGAVAGHHDDRATVLRETDHSRSSVMPSCIGHPDVEQHEVGRLARARRLRACAASAATSTS
jgi:hypothetical protein